MCKADLVSEGELSLLMAVDQRLCRGVLARPHREKIPNSMTEQKLCLGQVEVPDGCVPVLNKCLGSPDLVLVIKRLFAFFTTNSALRLE